MKPFFLFLGLSTLLSSAAMAVGVTVSCGAYLGTSQTETQLATVSLDTLSGEVSYEGINAPLKCKTPDASDGVAETINCVGVNTPHSIKFDVFSVDGILNMGDLTIDGVKVGYSPDPEKNEDLFCGRSSF